MAYALALDASEKMGEPGQIILIVTLLLASFTIFIMATCLYPIMVKCDVVRLKNDNV